MKFLRNLLSVPIYKTYGGMIASGKFEPVGFKLPLGFKDSRLALAAAEEVAVPMPIASLVHDRHNRYGARFGKCGWIRVARFAHKDVDCSASIRFQRLMLETRKRL